MPRPKKQVLKQRADGRYCCKYKGIQFMGNSSDEALQARENYKKQEASGDFIRANGPTVSDYAAEWLPRVKVNVSRHTYNESAGLLEKLLKHIGEMHFSSVLPSDIKNIYSLEFSSYSESYIRTASQLYRALFDSAQADGLCKSNPARSRSARPHQGTKGGHRSITDQERKWINSLCLDHRCRPAVMAMLYEGLRPPEAKAFDISKSVDFDSGKIHLMQFAHNGKNNHYKITDEGKTKKAKRDIPLFSPFKDAIKNKSGMLIPTARGGELTMQAWRVVWQSYVHQMEKEINGMEKRWYRRTKAHKKILSDAAQLRKDGKEAEAKAKEAEIPPWISFTVRPYDLRHSFATYCRDSGVEINTCIKWMGHADAKMILSIYDEVSEDREKREAQKLEKSLYGMQNGMQKLVFRVKRSNIKCSKL